MSWTPRSFDEGDNSLALGRDGVNFFMLPFVRKLPTLSMSELSKLLRFVFRDRLRFECFFELVVSGCACARGEREDGDFSIPIIFAEEENDLLDLVLIVPFKYIFS